MSYQMNLYINRTGKDWTKRADFLRYYNRTAPFYPDFKNEKAWLQAYREWEEKNSVLEIHKAWGIFYWILKNLASMEGKRDGDDVYFGEVTEAEYNKLVETCETALKTGEIPQGMKFKLMEEHEPYFWNNLKFSAETLTGWKTRIDWTKDKVYFYSHP